MKLDEMSIEKLYTLYNVATSICSEYSRMTDGYLLATGAEVEWTTGDKVLSMYETELIGDRQTFFSVKDRITNVLKRKLLEEASE